MSDARLRVLAALALTFNAFTWGVSWWPFRQLEGQGLHALWATALIYSVAVLAITLARAVAWRYISAGLCMLPHPLHPTCT